MYQIVIIFNKITAIYSLFYEILRTFFVNIIGLPWHRNKRKSVLEIPKMFSFYIQIIKLYITHAAVFERSIG